MAFSRQLSALLHKNFIIKKRLWKQTIWEFIIPVFFSYILSFAKADTSSSQGSIYVVLLIALAVPTAFQATCRFILM
jgi:4-hydroxybenzoate polyprenyltransferase